MIDELSAYIAMVNATTNSFWNNVEGAKDYDENLAKKSTDDPARYGDKTWKDDPIESARRIWEWWRAKKDDVRIRHLVVAARLVALVQVSSASVERVFSQVKLICETCGVSPLEETLETRLMERVNQYED